MTLRTSTPYTPEEDEIIRSILETRPRDMSLKQAIAKDLHLLPGRTIDGALYRWHQHISNKRDLENARKKAAEKKAEKRRAKQGGRKGSVIEQWTPDEDAILWNTVQMNMQQTHGNLRDALREGVEKLPGRTFSSVINRYYNLRNKFGDTETAYLPSPEPAEQPQQLSMPEEPEQPQQPAQPAQQVPYMIPTSTANFSYHTFPSQQPATTYTYNVATQQPAFVPPTTPAPIEQPAAPVEAGPLVSRAEEFIRELYGVVEHNSSLREEVQTLRADAGTVTQLRAELQAERDKVIRLTRKVAEMEEDQAAFLKLMDKARQIGRAESGV